MKQNKLSLLAALVGVIATTALVSTITFAADSQTDSTGFSARRQEFQQQRQEFQQDHQAVQTAVENGDYTTWQNFMQERVDQMRQRATELEGKITEDNFTKLQQAHQLMQDGQKDEARAIMEELGLGGFGPGRGGHFGPGRGPAPTDQINP